MAEPDEATISYSSIAFVLGLAFIIYRYFSSPSSSDTTSSASSRPQGQRYTDAQVDQVVAMFPQLSRRDIAWDLQRNRGNVDGTIERILSGRGLDAVCAATLRTHGKGIRLLTYVFQAPLSFQIASTEPQTTRTSTGTSTGTLSSLLSGKKADSDLISRYKLQDRISASDKGKAVESSTPQNNTWAPTKVERQEVLRRRRDEMILEARRKMLERDAAAS